MVGKLQAVRRHLMERIYPYTVTYYSRAEYLDTWVWFRRQHMKVTNEML